MRDIKFRAWQKEHLEMCDVTAIDECKGLLGFGNNEGEVDYWLDADECILMQYTGLTDKNGKEIYEGDIISNGKLTYKVVFEKGSFCLHSIKKQKRKRSYFLSQVIEFADCYDIQFGVIGNIYENKELLGE